MKIGMFTDTYVPQINGVATSVHLLMETLRAMDHDVHVFTTTDPEAADDEPDYIHRVPSAPILQERRLGLIYHPKLARELKHLGFDIIHTHTEFSLGWIGKRLAEDEGIPYVHTYHTIYEDYTHFVAKGESMNRVARSAARAYSRVFCNDADEVIVPTVKVKQLLMDYEVIANIHVVPTGIDLSRFHCEDGGAAWREATRRELGLGPDQFVAVSIGRVSQEKNIQEIIDILAGWLPKHPDARFIIIGDGAYRPTLEAKVRALGLTDQVLFTGYRPYEHIAHYYYMGDVFLSASRSETQGLTYIEALASGLPVVARRDACLDGVVTQGTNGWVYDTPDEACRYLDTLYGDAAVRRQMGQAAADSMAPYAARHFAGSVLRVYEQARFTAEGRRPPLSLHLLNPEDETR